MSSTAYIYNFAKKNLFQQTMKVSKSHVSKTLNSKKIGNLTLLHAQITPLVIWHTCKYYTYQMLQDKVHQLVTKGFNKTKEQIHMCFFNVSVTCLPDNDLQCNGQCRGITDKTILFNVQLKLGFYLFWYKYHKSIFPIAYIPNFF